jgi:acyl carrier protein
MAPASDGTGGSVRLFVFGFLAHQCHLPAQNAGQRKTLKMNVRTEIVNQFKQVAQEQDKRLAPLTDGLELLESGLDSLSMAILVIRLEDSLGINPFNSEDAHFPVTFGNFVKLYEHAAK